MKKKDANEYYINYLKNDFVVEIKEENKKRESTKEEIQKELKKNFEKDEEKLYCLV
jgi:hypothetical protein